MSGCGLNLTIKKTIITGGGGSAVVDEVCEKINGVFDGNNRIFNTSFDFVQNTLDISCNGVVQTPGTDFLCISDNMFSLGWAPTTTETILARYIKKQ